MVRSLHKTKILFAVLFSTITPASIVSFAYAENPQNFDFKVNVAEVLTITVTNPANWASGNVNDFLRNKVTVSASTNNPIGVTVSMYTDLNQTDLRNIISYDSTKPATYIPTMAQARTRANFQVNEWGYSVSDTDAGDETSNYYALRDRSNPIELFSTLNTSTVGVGEEDVYFGAKADSTKQSGTYAQTVYFAAVTGTIDTADNPVIPVNPSRPDPTTDIARYNSSTGNTTYTTRTTAGTGATATETEETTVTKGDVTSAYANAAGVTTSTSGASNNTALVAALAAGAAVSAVSGIAFFVAAKRKKDDEEG